MARLRDRLAEDGRLKERGECNRLRPVEVLRIYETLERFGVPKAKLAAVRLGLAKEKVYIEIERGLEGKMWNKGQRVPSDGRNVFVGLANVYIHVSNPRAFAYYLGSKDLKADEGRFNSKRFIAKVRAWNDEQASIRREASRVRRLKRSGIGA